MVENNNYKLINPENFIYFLYRDENKPKKRKLVYVKSHTKEKNIINEINRKLYKNKQIKFNNKNKIFNNLYNFTKNNNFKYTVVVFDFKNFGSSLNINYVLEKYKIKNIFSIEENNFLKEYASYVKYCRGGINLNTTLSEIILTDFDNKFKSLYKDIIFYERFADDIFIIFDNIIDEKTAKLRISTIINKVFFDSKIKHKNKTKVHFDKKYIFFTSNSYKNFDFLGVNLTFDNNKIIFNITENDKKKIQAKITYLIEKYKDNPSAIKCVLNILAKGIIYKKIRNNREKWVFKGFVSKYRFLSQFRNFGLSKDYYIELLKQILIQYNLLNLFKNDLNKYDIVHNAEHKKYFVLDKRLGIPKEKLLKIMSVLGKNYNYDVKYFDIAKDLIKIFRNK